MVCINGKKHKWIVCDDNPNFEKCVYCGSVRRRFWRPKCFGTGECTYLGLCYWTDECKPQKRKEDGKCIT